MQKVGFGGGCHWCTEAVFQSLKGVQKVEQGWICSSLPDASNESEAVIVHFDKQIIPLDILIEIHLLTHHATSNHTFRAKYRSAVYTFSQSQEAQAALILEQKQALFSKPLVTRVYPFASFKGNLDKYLNYYQQNPEKPFCKTYINPKLQMLMKAYKVYTIT